MALIKLLLEYSDRYIFHWLMPIMIFTIDSNAFPATTCWITNVVLFLSHMQPRSLSKQRSVLVKSCGFDLCFCLPFSYTLKAKTLAEVY